LACGIYFPPAENTLPNIPPLDQLEHLNDEELALYYAQSFVRLRNQMVNERRVRTSHHEAYLKECLSPFEQNKP
ncbi:hypothetical protein, partial [Klebsiella pneumoniae]|uniref:hypothetical protein n=1 Tax=Klebsiella pneumoniae TaxID=573 RepID=UPI00226E5BA1